MKLYSWNVNGIRSVLRKDAFLPFIAHEQPDILCIQETKAQPGEAVIDLPEYHEYWHSADKKGYSGTAIFSKVEPLSKTIETPDKQNALLAGGMTVRLTMDDPDYPAAMLANRIFGGTFASRLVRRTLAAPRWTARRSPTTSCTR